jgi:transcriptional regulator with XRE-family HTH domain
MASVDASLAATLGDRFRLARTVIGMRQEDVAIQAGVSRTMVCRMELGQGGSISMDSWAAVASVLGVELLAEFREPERSRRGHVTLRCHALVARVARDGGWRTTTEIVRASRDCAPATVETILVRPFRYEAAVVHAWHPVPNVGLAVYALGARRDELRRTFGSRWAVSALVLCPSTTADRRRVSELASKLATALPATAGDWIGALRHSRMPMPSDGLIWTDRWAQRFRPGGRHPGWQRPA